MKRLWLCMVLAAAQPAWAGEAPYYGPMKRWHGIGYPFGYRDGVAKDGAWRIDTVTRRGDAIDMALYRAAERARAEGYAYVFFLGGSAATSPGMSSATVYARPSHAADAPTGCRSKRSGTCYTADAAEVMRVLGGPGGAQPGVAIVDHHDRFGREVTLSGYGTGGVAAVSGLPPRSSTATIRDGRLAIRGGREGIEKMEARIAAATKVPLPVAVSVPGPGPVRPVVVAARPVAMPVPVRATPVVLASASVARPVVVATRMVSRPAQVSSAAERFQQALQAVQPVRGREPRLGWTISD